MEHVRNRGGRTGHQSAIERKSSEPLDEQRGTTPERPHWTPESSSRFSRAVPQSFCKTSGRCCGRRANSLNLIGPRGGPAESARAGRGRRWPPCHRVNEDIGSQPLKLYPAKVPCWFDLNLHARYGPI